MNRAWGPKEPAGQHQAYRHTRSILGGEGREYLRTWWLMMSPVWWGALECGHLRSSDACKRGELLRAVVRGLPAGLGVTQWEQLRSFHGQAHHAGLLYAEGRRTRPSTMETAQHSCCPQTGEKFRHFQSVTTERVCVPTGPAHKESFRTVWLGDMRQYQTSNSRAREEERTRAAATPKVRVTVAVLCHSVFPRKLEDW